MATWANDTKKTSTFQNILRHGSATLLSDLENFTFESVVFPSGKQLKDVTFADLVNQVWSNVSKNSSTFTNVSKS